MKIDFEQLILALSDSVDLVGIDEVQHGKRVAFMAWECAAAMGMSAERKKALLYLGLLHDCGVSSTREHRSIIDEIDWADSFLHCQVGARRMQHFKPLACMADVILYHHHHWQDLQQVDVPEQTKLDSNLIYLLDRVDALAAPYLTALGQADKDEIRSKIANLRNAYFQSDLVDIFLDVSAREAFWFALEPMYLQEFFQHIEPSEQRVVVDSSGLKSMAELFAQIVDAKSPYTAEHSHGVARLSRFLAELCGLDNSTWGKVEVAGLLHDLGKLQVPDSVLEKAGKLDGEDLSFMRHHSYVTYKILQKIEGMEEIAVWTANHHEALDGSGYPFRRKGNDLDLQSRIIIVADIFQALAQNRPYREAQQQDAIVAILQGQARGGRLDKDLVELIVRHLDACYREATTLG